MTAWVVCHPLYTPNNQGPFFFRHLESPHSDEFQVPWTQLQTNGLSHWLPHWLRLQWFWIQWFQVWFTANRIKEAKQETFLVPLSEVDLMCWR